MPLFQVKMIVDHPRREVSPMFAGCVDAADAIAKARSIYTVLVVKSVTEVKR